MVTTPGGERARRPRRRRHDVRRRAGGRGGLGNAALASARRKAPGFALLGEPGEARTSSWSSRPSPTSRSSASPAPASPALIAAHLGGQAQDRRLPVHDARAQPRRGRGRRRPLHGRRRARPDPGRQRGQGPRPGVPAPRRALLRRSCTSSTARPWSPAATRSPTSTSSRPSSRPTAGSGRPAADRRPQQDRRPRGAELAEMVTPDLEARGPTGLRGLARPPTRACASCPSRSRRSSPRPAPPRRSRRPTRDRAPPEGRRRRRLHGRPRGASGRATWSAARSRSAGSARPTSPTTRPSATSPTGSPGSASRTSWSPPAPQPGDDVAIGEDERGRLRLGAQPDAGAEMLRPPRPGPAPGGR